MSHLSSLEKKKKEIKERKRRLKEQIEKAKKAKQELEEIGVVTQGLSAEEVNKVYEKRKEQLVEALMKGRNLPESKRQLLENQSLEVLFVGYEKLLEKQEKERKKEFERKKKEMNKHVQNLEDLFS